MGDVPKRATPFTRMLASFQLLRDVIATKGLYIPTAFVKDILGVSRQRVDQLIRDGRLETIMLNDRHYVLETSLASYIQAGNDSRGLDITLPKDKREAWGRALKFGKEFSASDK